MTSVKLWALWSRDLGCFHMSYPKDTPILYRSRRDAVAARLSGSYYGYQPVKVEFRHSQEGQKP
jgi:hypothetical protein